MATRGRSGLGKKQKALIKRYDTQTNRVARKSNTKRPSEG